RAIEVLSQLRADAPQNFPADTFESILAIDGVAWRIGAARSTLDTAFAQYGYLGQTLQRGSIDDAFSFVRSAPKLATEDYAARDLYLRRGALLCLSGAEAEGRAAFHDGMRINAQHHDFPFHEARIGLAACGEMTEPKSDDLDRDALWTFEIGAKLIGGALEDNIAGPYGNHTRRSATDSPCRAAALAALVRPLGASPKLVAALSTVT